MSLIKDLLQQEQLSATISLIDINLIGTDEWSDLITGCVFDDLQADIELKPYESVWISNAKA